MATTKENFAKLYNHVKQSIVEEMDRTLERAIGNNALDFEKMEDNFLDVYPLIAAVLQRELHGILDRSSYEQTRRSQKRKAGTYRRDYRIWQYYVGDYRSRKDSEEL